MKAKILMMLLAGMVVLAACKNRGKYEVAVSSADTVKVDSIGSIGPKLVKTAGIGFKVKDVQQSSEKITALTTRYNGMVIHHRISSTANSSHDIKVSDDSVLRISSFYTTGEMTVKIPAGKVELYLDSIGRLGIYVNNSSMDIEDKTFDYLSSRLKLNSRKEMVSSQKSRKIIIKDPSAVLNLKDDLVDEQINNSKIDDAVKYSVVTLTFYQSNSIIKEVIANDDPAAYRIPFFKSLALALANGWTMFMAAIILAADLWVFILAGVFVWLAIRYYKRKTQLKPIVV